MIESILLRSCSAPPLLLDAKHRHGIGKSSTKFGFTIRCSSKNQADHIPKPEPFTRTKLERVVKEPPLIQTSEKLLSEYCSTLEGEESHSCWQAYLELKDLQKEWEKADIERLILENEGVKSLIGCLHGITKMQKEEEKEKEREKKNSRREVNLEELQRRCPIPDGLPKSAEELQEEEEARMPDSAHTRLLRRMGRFPAWFTPPPDHQTD